MADNSSKYTARAFGTKNSYDLVSPDKDQTAIVYDLLAEGPIAGLSNDLASVYYNDVPLVDSANNDILKPRKFTVTTVAAQTTITASEFGTIRTLSYNNKSGIGIGARAISIVGAGTKGTGIASITAGSSKVTTSSNYFTQALIDNQAKSVPVYIRIAGAGAGGQDLVCSIKKMISATTAELTIRAFNTVSSANITQDHSTRISTISGNTATLVVAPATAVSNTICVVSSPSLAESDQLTNFSNISFGITSGTALQAPLIAPGFAGSSSTVYDANIKIGQTHLRNISALSSLGANYNNVNIDEPGNEYEGSESPKVITASAMGVSNPQEIDEIHLTFGFPEMHAFKSSGAKGPSFVELQMFFEYTSDGTNYTSALAFGPSYADILNRTPSWGNKATFGIEKYSSVPNNGYVKPTKAQYSEYIEEFVMNVEQFQPFTNYRVRIHRLTDDEFKDGSFQHQNGCFLKTIENITKDRLSYPYAAYAANVFNAKDFSGGLPSRAYKLKGKLIKVPTNYLTRDESSDGQAKYTRLVGGSAPGYSVSEEASYQTWNGAFRGDRSSWAEGHPNRELVYCNNPAWVFYDILTNNRYGVGQFVDENLIDKYSLFEIAKYCDELVSDGEGGLEPRFTTNLYLDKTAEATKVLRDIASIFRGMVLWSEGEIVAISDRPKEIVYTFTKGNVENGLFTYEGTGDRVRTNQVKVTWNDPADNYRQAIEYVEDHQSILNTNRLVREASVAFGCTSRAQAHRYGKWKLLSAQLEKETVSFTTGLNAIGLKPGDIIGVQDADKDGYQYSGRVSNTGTKSTTVIPLDRTITLPSYAAAFPPQLLLIYPEGGCYLEQEVAVINSVTYKRGDLLLENQDGTALDTQSEAANLKDDSGDRVLNFWSENVRVEKQNISTNAGSVSSLTVASAFSSTPDSEIIWALQLFNSDGTPKTGTTKEFKVISVKEEKDQKVQIVGAEFAKAKFAAVDRGYTLYSNPTDGTPDKDDVIPSPTNIVAKVEPMTSESPDLGETVDIGGTGGAKVTVSWNAPLTSEGLKFKHIAGFEIKHSFNGGFESIKTNGHDQVYEFLNVPVGTYDIHIRTYTTVNTFSQWITRTVQVGKDEIPFAAGFNKSQISLGGQLNQAISIDSSSGVLAIGSSTYNFIGINGTEYVLEATGTGNYQQAFSGMGASAEAYLLFDADATSDHLKAVEIKTDSNVAPAIEYWAEVGASNNGLTQATGTVTVAQFSNQIDGTGTTFTSDFSSGSLVKLDNGTAAEATYARIQSIESDTLMFMDLVSQRAYSGEDVYKQSFKPNLLSDSLIAKITTSSGTVYSINVVYGITAGITGADGADGAAGVSGRTVSLIPGDPSIEYNTNGTSPNPSSTTITATATNTTDTVYYQFFLNDSSVQNTTSNTYSYTPQSSFANMPDKVEVQIREGSNSGTILARDITTMAGLKAGVDAITIILSNEAHTVPVSTAGTITFTGSGTDIEVYSGTTQLNYATSGNSTFNVSAASASSIVGIGAASTISSNIRRFAAATSLSQDTGQITFTITVRNEAGATETFTKVQTITKSKQGATGADGAVGRTVKLIPSKHVINYSTAGAESDSITFTNEAFNFTTPYYRFLVGGVEKQAYSTTSTFTLADGDEPAIGGIVSVKVQVKENNAGSVAASDVVSIFAVQDGSDAVTGFLTNASHSVTADSSGTVSSFSGAGGTFKVFVGGTEVTTSCTFSTTGGTGVAGSINSASGVYTISSMSANQGTRTFQAVIPAATAGTASNVTITADYSISKSIAGTDGASVTGPAGLRTIQGYLYYEKTTAGAPSAPSGTTYTFSTGVVSGTGINDSGSTNVWRNSPTTQSATSTNVWWTVRYYGTESSAGSSTITVAYSNVVQLTSFTGVVTFSGGTFSDDGGNITTIDGGNIAASSTITVGGDGQVLVDGANNRIIVSD